MDLLLSTIGYTVISSMILFVLLSIMGNSPTIWALWIIGLGVAWGTGLMKVTRG